jgi:diguanylate cyclase (GGDEF)-like protein
MGDHEGGRDILDALALGVIRVDAGGFVRFANPAADAVLGAPIPRDRPFWALVVADERDRVAAEIADQVANEGSFTVETRFDRADGGICDGRVIGRPMSSAPDADLVMSIRDIEREVASNTMRRRFEAALDTSADVVVFAEPDGTITYANQTAQSYLAGSTSLAELFDEVSRITLVDSVLPQVFTDGFWAGELALALGDAYTVPVNVVVLTHLDDQGGLEYLSLVAHDIASLKEAQRALEAQATHDALTGLVNRARFLELLRDALSRMERTGEAVAVMFTDLDGFKAVNDGLGHEAGDELLIAVGRRMVGCVRDSDVVARFGGDEFVLLLNGIEDLTVAQRVADRLMAAIEEPIALTNGEGNVGTSIGIAIANDPHVAPDAILAEADTAMYRAKQLGKRRYQLFDDDLRARASARQSLLDDVVVALDRREFTVMYTPVVDTATGALVTVESALRWLHRKRGTIGVAEFAPLAREAGCWLQLNEMLIRDAATHAGQWNADRSTNAITTWVTIGAQELLQGDLERLLSLVIDEHRLGPGALGVEVPLSVLTKHPREAERLLQALSWMGVRIAIDDFGADPFVPAQLQRFHVDTVKLDRRFVRTLSDAPEAISALSGIVAFARALGLAVTAKGVERPAEIELLQELGCSFVQGTAVARPMPAARLGALLAGRGPWQDAWPDASLLGGPLSRPQVVERMLRLRRTA